MYLGQSPTVVRVVSCIVAVLIAYVVPNLRAAEQAETDAKAAHWAFQPVSQPPIPCVTNKKWTKNAIDCFILARLEAAGLEPTAPATCKDLRRRIYFDLIGLPPPLTRNHSATKTNPTQDPESEIDLLLGSPDYGPRWARHWLDVVRYADSNGLDENAAHANAWRYRDYVVQSFNADKPFDRFLVEQIAGDLLPANTEIQRQEQLIATGFLSLGPKVLAEPDKVKMEMDIIDEQIGTIGQACLGLTIGCARCHDHKFDPLSMEDYYALAGIFKSTKTMESLQTIARWHENSMATPEQKKLGEDHEAVVAAQEKVIAAYVQKANQELLIQQNIETPPDNPEEHYAPVAKEELKILRDTLKRLKTQQPILPTAMGVVAGNVENLPLFFRGDHNSPGKIQPRRFPRALVVGDPQSFGEETSGRLELAQWIADSRNPLTARVIVNRVWRGHFGKGLVTTPDNFGLLGQPPTHPKLLDWLTVWFTENGWSIKKLHRLILTSATYQMSSNVDARALQLDPENQLYWHAPLRRLEAEPLRDTLLTISGMLDKQLGGSLWEHENFNLVFNHTSKDETTYENDRRAIYLPIIRNHVYGMFELFDFPDPATVGGDRSSTTIAPQALFLLNSPLAMRSTEKLATSLLAKAIENNAQRLQTLYGLAYNRLPTEKEQQQALNFVAEFATAQGDNDVAQNELTAWQSLCQAVFASNEFMYLR